MLATGELAYGYQMISKALLLVPCRFQHASKTCLKGFSEKATLISRASRKKKNADFVKRWNKENQELFGPKLRVSKKTLMKRAENAQYELGDAHATQYSPGEMSWPGNSLSSPHDIDADDIEQKQGDDIKTPSVSIIKQTTKDVRGELDATPAVSSGELGAVLRFPLFRPDLPALEAAGWMGLSEVSVLRNQNPVRVSRVLDATKSKQSQIVLNRWIQQQIAQLGKEGFAAAQKKRLRGASTLHGCLEQFLQGTPKHMLNLEEDILPYWHSINPVLEQVDNVLGVEVKLDHEQLAYCGTADCIANYRGELCLIDWKTSGKPKASLTDLYDYPLQVAAYLGAYHFNRNSSPIEKEAFIENLLIVVAYEDGSPAHAHFIPRRQALRFWGEWTQRLSQYWTNVILGESEN